MARYGDNELFADIVITVMCRVMLHASQVTWVTECKLGRQLPDLQYSCLLFWRPWLHGCIPVWYCNLCIFIVMAYVFLLYVYVSSSCQLALL